MNTSARKCHKFLLWHPIKEVSSMLPPHFCPQSTEHQWLKPPQHLPRFLGGSLASRITPLSAAGIAPVAQDSLLGTEIKVFTSRVPERSLDREQGCSWPGCSELEQVRMKLANAMRWQERIIYVSPAHCTWRLLGVTAWGLGAGRHFCNSWSWQKPGKKSTVGGAEYYLLCNHRLVDSSVRTS